MAEETASGCSRGSLLGTCVRSTCNRALGIVPGGIFLPSQHPAQFSVAPRNSPSHLLSELLFYLNQQVFRLQQISWLVQYRGRCHVWHGARDLEPRDLRPSVCSATDSQPVSPKCRFLSGTWLSSPLLLLAAVRSPWHVTKEILCEGRLKRLMGSHILVTSLGIQAALALKC